MIHNDVLMYGTRGLTFLLLKYKMFEVETSKAQNPLDCGIGYD